MKKIAAIIEARMSSSRLPGKVLKMIGNKPSLLHTIHRLRMVKNIDDIIVATTYNKSDDLIVNFCKKNKVSFCRGSEQNVLNRVLKTAKQYKVKTIVEITGDSVFLDYKLIDQAIKIYNSNNYDFVANCAINPTFIAGFDVRIFSTKKLEKVKTKITDKSDFEHVSSFFWRNPNLFKIFNIKPSKKLQSGKVFLGLDTKEDLKMLREIYKSLGKNDKYFDANEIVDFIKKNPRINKFNAKIIRNKV